MGWIRLLGATATACLAAGSGTPARADRLGGNYRGPDDVCVVREDPPPADPPPAEPESPGAPPKPPTSTPEGGPHRGPSGEVPPGDRGGNGGDGAPAPSDGGSGGPPAPSPPSTGGGSPSPAPAPGEGGTGAPSPGSGASAPAAHAGSAGAAGKPGRTSPDDRDRIWTFYFEAAKEEYLAAVLARRPEARIAPPRTSTWMLSLQPEPPSPRRAIGAADREAAFRLVLGRLRDPDSHVRDAAVIALGKSGRAEAVPFLRMTADRDADPAVREDALLALGLTGDREEALPALLAALDAPPPGARERRVAFAALGLGLLGDLRAAAPLRALLESAAGGPALAGEAGCAATALGLLGDPAALPVFARVLASRDSRDEVKGLVLHAAGRLGAHPSADARREAFEVIRSCLDGREELRRSALLALGSFAEPATAAPSLARGILDPDPSCRTYAAHSLGRLAARSGPADAAYAAAARELARWSASDRRDRWLFQSGNLALASMACPDREEDLRRLVEGREDLDLHSASSVVVALGMIGPESAAAVEGLRRAFESRTSGADVQAYAGLALAMAGAPGASAPLVRALGSAAPGDASLARTTALALGLIGGAAEADLLVDVLRGRVGGDRRGGDRMFLCGAAVQGLGLIADGDTVGKLEPLLGPGEPWTARAFATAALGYVLETDPARRVSPRISEIFRHHDRRSAFPIARAVESSL